MTRAVWLLACASCVHHDLGDRAPAHVDVTTPPAQLAARRLEPGRDPGERWIALLPGPSFSLALQSRRAQDEGAFGLGFELTVRAGTLAETHVHPLRGPPPWAPAAVTPGLNLGLVHLFGGIPNAAATNLYGELQISYALLGAAAGWSLSPGDGHGPQATAFAGPLFARASRRLGRATTVELGLVVKGDVTWIWSR